MIDCHSLVREARSLLFVPGERLDRVEKALATTAGAIVLDLDASVRPLRKSAARDAVRELLAAGRGNERILVRINAVASEWFAEDLAMVPQAKCAVMLPMVSGIAEVRAARVHLPSAQPLVALIETAAGILAAPEVARVEGVTRLAFGNMDYETETRTSGRDSQIVPAAMLVLASRAAHLPAPIAGVTAAFRDDGRLADDLAWERAQGFGGKLCIHPRQVPFVARAFAPTPAEIEWAQRVVAGAGHSFAAALDDELVDRPVIERARRILAEMPNAERS